MPGLEAIEWPHALLALGAFVLGSAVGSFLNVCIWRIPRGLSIVSPLRSFCPHCGRPIRARDNVPLVSFALLRARCRDCGAPISWRYPLVEGVTGALFAALYLTQRQGGPGPLILMALVVSLLVAASAIDMELFIIPDEISIFGLAGGLLAGLLLPQMHVGTAPYHTVRALTGVRALDGLIGSAIGAASGGGLVLAFAAIGALIFRKEALGIGDVKLMAMVGAFMGWKVAVLAFFLAPFFGLFYGVPLLLVKREHVMPFGPFLSAGAVVVIMLRAEACELLNTYVQTVGELLRLAL